MYIKIEYNKFEVSLAVLHNLLKINDISFKIILLQNLGLLEEIISYYSGTNLIVYKAINSSLTIAQLIDTGFCLGSVLYSTMRCLLHCKYTL